MVDLTILELNLEGAEFTANAPLSGEKGEKKGLTGRVGSGGIRGRLRSGDSEEMIETDESGGGPSPLLAVLAVAVTLVAVALVRRLASGGEEEPEPETESRIRSLR